MSANGTVALEPIYAAFFALLTGSGSVPACTWINPVTGSPITFAVESRVPRDWQTLTPGQLPALFQEELGFEIVPTVPTLQARTKYELRVDVVVIVSCAGAKQPVGQETQVPSQELNLAISAVLNAVAAPAGQKQNLGGLVDSVVAKGRVERINGLPGAGSQLSIAVVPFTILTI